MKVEIRELQATRNAKEYATVILDDAGRRIVCVLYTRYEAQALLTKAAFEALLALPDGAETVQAAIGLLP